MGVLVELLEGDGGAQRERLLRVYRSETHRFMMRHAASGRTYAGSPATNVAATGLRPRR